MLLTSARSARALMMTTHRAGAVRALATAAALPADSLGFDAATKESSSKREGGRPLYLDMQATTPMVCAESAALVLC